jgi:hypothetical protein
VSPRPSPPAAPASGPALSIVVASFRAPAVLRACLDRLLPQCARHGVEAIVARPPAPGDLEALAEAHTGLRVVAAPADADVPRLRGAGLAAARGRLVALTEDHCRPAPDWVERLLTHVGRDGAVGGAMENAARTRTVDWGAYFAEYGFFAAASPAAAAGTPALTGANVAYDRAVVGRVARWASAGAWENVIHARLAADGVALRFDPMLVVAQGLTYAVPAFCRDRYRHGVDYARTRIAEERASGATRWIRAMTAPALPPLLAWRIARRARRPGQRAAFAAALPFTLTFLAAWSLGEAAGYVRGAGR